MEIPPITHLILDTILLLIYLLHTLLCSRTFAKLPLYQKTNFVASFFTLTLSGVLLGFTWAVQGILIDTFSIFPSLFECLRLTKALDMPFTTPRAVCFAVATSSSLSKLLADILSIHICPLLQCGIVVLFVLDYLCLALGFYWLSRKSIPGHLGRSQSQREMYRLYLIAFVLLIVAVPGAILGSWRLCLELQMISSGSCYLRHVRFKRSRTRTERDSLPNHRGRLTCTDGDSLTYENMILAIYDEGILND